MKISDSALEVKVRTTDMDSGSATPVRSSDSEDDDPDSLPRSCDTETDSNVEHSALHPVPSSETGNGMQFTNVVLI